MGLAQTIAPLAIAAADPSTFTLVIVILGALFSLIAGGYMFTWVTYNEGRKTAKDLYEKIEKVRNNDVHGLEKRIRKLEVNAGVGPSPTV